MDTSITSIKGIGAARAAAFEKVGIKTLGDLISYYPRTYEDRSVIKKLGSVLPYESCSVIASVTATPTLSRIRKGLDILRFTISDGSGVCQVSYFNQSFLKSKFQKGQTYLFYGKFEGNLLRHSISNPYFEPLGFDETPLSSPIVPIYPLTKGLTQKVVASSVQAALSSCQLSETLPPHLLAENKLISYQEAIKYVHSPSDMAQVKAGRDRLIFEELLILQLGLFMLKGRRQDKTGTPCFMVDLAPFYSQIGFPLTQAQLRCINEGIADMTGEAPMNRLVQGDVGSGKTLVAAALCYFAIKNGYQAAFMAPTEILAVQHFNNLQKLFEPLGIKVDLLTGSTKKSDKKLLLESLSCGDISLLVATHAVLEDNVVFDKLGLIVCDEQHRFGVKQRGTLSLKGDRVHMLVMSATPIPRTLALMIYGDLDVSVIDQLPPGRVPTATHLVNELKRGQVNAFIEKKLQDGRQGYIVCPLVEESDATYGLKDVITYTENFKKLFPDTKISFIHGKMKAADKDEQMRLFASGETRLLVATTVIEVGVDIKNATFIIIENAERFGLSQLHQLRGRVGRGVEKSYCIMVSNSEDPDTKKRLEVMTQTTDGFEIAKMDLELRGPGDFFGSRQHGLPSLKIAEMAGDTKLLYAAQTAAQTIIKEDPTLSLPKHKGLFNSVISLFSMDKGNFLN